MNFPINKSVIESLIPHRDPFLLIDEVLSAEPGVRAVAKKSLIADEWFFKGHFPSHPVMPGVLIVEALAQTASVCASLSLESTLHGKPVYFVAIDEAKFRKPALPGDIIYFHVELIKSVRSVWFFNCAAKVNDILISNAVIRATMP